MKGKTFKKQDIFFKNCKGWSFYDFHNVGDEILNVVKRAFKLLN